ncbi:hypothetical protein ACJHYR_04985 [Escherichia sp. WS1450]|uniref:hypothetical protein n=1 Tax=Escherichia sp. WS1450 TaxID=3381940 RepID=UPI00396F2F55
MASKSPKRSLEAGATRMDARRGRILQGRSLAPDPVAARDKLREPRSGDFVRQSLGVQGAAAIGRPLRAPCASDFIWHNTLKERNRSHIPNSFAHMLSNQP